MLIKLTPESTYDPKKGCDLPFERHSLQNELFLSIILVKKTIFGGKEAELKLLSSYQTILFYVQYVLSTFLLLSYQVLSCILINSLANKQYYVAISGQEIGSIYFLKKFYHKKRNFNIQSVAVILIFQNISLVQPKLIQRYLMKFETKKL